MFLRRIGRIVCTAVLCLSMVPVFGLVNASAEELPPEAYLEKKLQEAIAAQQAGMSAGQNVATPVIANVPTTAATSGSAALSIGTVDLIVFAGQSNMSGAGGNAAAAPAVPNGQGYEFRAISDPTGLHPITEPFGVTEAGYAGETAATKKGSLVSSFVGTYYAKTGTPVVAVSASRGGTDMDFWTSPNVIADINSRYTKAKNFLEVNHYNVRKKYVVWLQGESDGVEGRSAQEYKNCMETTFAPLFANGLDQVFVITPGRALGNIMTYDTIINAQKNLCAVNYKYTLASDMLRNLPDAYFADQVHYNQTALNMVGADAAARVAAYTAATVRK